MKKRRIAILLVCALLIGIGSFGCAKQEPPKETLVKTVTIGETEMGWR